jgi:hypothetical protein
MIPPVSAQGLVLVDAVQGAAVPLAVVVVDAASAQPDEVAGVVEAQLLAVAAFPGAPVFLRVAAVVRHAAVAVLVRVPADAGRLAAQAAVLAQEYCAPVAAPGRNAALAMVLPRVVLPEQGRYAAVLHAVVQSIQVAAGDCLHAVSRLPDCLQYGWVAVQAAPQVDGLRRKPEQARSM